MGIGIGILCCLPATILFRSYFYGIGPTEWPVLIPVGVGMLLLSLGIAYVSAKPWLNADPMQAVRHA
jgi:hypothetical protein